MHLNPATAVADLQTKQAVHAAIAALPESQRLVTTLFSVEGYSLREIAKFLEVPIPTIKKHLYTARKQLSERMITIVREQLQESKPSHKVHFGNKVLFFLALQTRDMRQVKTLVQGDSDLLYAQIERGMASEAYCLPLGSTALHWASATEDEPLPTYLLARGADVNVKDPRGMTSLHLAARLRQPAMIRLLLAHGADIKAASAPASRPSIRLSSATVWRSPRRCWGTGPMSMPSISGNARLTIGRRSRVGRS